MSLQASSLQPRGTIPSSCRAPRPCRPRGSQTPARSLILGNGEGLDSKVLSNYDYVWLFDKSVAPSTVPGQKDPHRGPPNRSKVAQRRLAAHQITQLTCQIPWTPSHRPLVTASIRRLGWRERQEASSSRWTVIHQLKSHKTQKRLPQLQSP